MTTRPTTLNSMTHYALTEEQEEVMDAEDDGGALMDALQSTPADPTANRVSSAVESGLLIPIGELQRMMEGDPPPDMTEEEAEAARHYEEEQRDGRG